MKITFTFLFTLSLLFQGRCQSYFLRQLSIADAYYKKEEYAYAVPYYRKSIRASKDELYPIKQLGECYRHLKKWKEAQKVYTYLAEKDNNKENIQKLAQILLRIADVKQARQKFNSIQDSVGIANCDSITYWLSHPRRFKLSPIKFANTLYSELSPVVYKNGLVYSSNKEGTIIKKKSGNTGLPYYNLYFLDSTSKKAIPFSSLMNSITDEGSVTFTGDFNRGYFSRAKLDKDKVIRMKLYSAERRKYGWSFTQEFIFNDSCYSFGQPNVDRDDKLFFFVSDMKGGFGGTDIYVCVKVDSMWSNPINLGATINTNGNETFPFYSHDEKLYFSSNGRLGMGGYDIFMAEQKGGEWVKVDNMGHPINSLWDDYSYYQDKEGKKGFLSSNRPGGKGLEDIYSFVRY